MGLVCAADVTFCFCNHVQSEHSCTILMIINDEVEVEANTNIRLAWVIAVEHSGIPNFHGAVIMRRGFGFSSSLLFQVERTWW